MGEAVLQVDPFQTARLVLLWVLLQPPGGHLQAALMQLQEAPKQLLEDPKPLQETPMQHHGAPWWH